MAAITQLKHFSGGLTLAAHKQPSNILDSGIPNELIYPLLQRADCYAQPIVKTGDAVLKGQLIAHAGSALSTPIHAASSGVIKEIAAHLIAHPSGLTDLCIVISTDGLDTALEPEPCIDYQSESISDLRTKIQQAGIVGLGGAVFPTAKKLAAPQKIDTLIINAAECEPYISCDESLILAHAEQLIQGVLILQYITQAEQCIIALEESMPQAFQALQKATQKEAIQLIRVPEIYPTGGEKQLIQVLTGKKIPAQSLPAEQGMLCQNIGTAYAVYQAIILGVPLTERIITVTGKGIQHSQNIQAKIGTPIKHLIAECQGYTNDVQRLIMGGSMMGIALSSDEIAVTKATNCILALSSEELAAQTQEMPCIRCGDCANVCPVELLPQQLYWYGRSQQLEQCLDYRLLDCIECGCCDIVCPSQIPLVQLFRAIKGEHTIKQQQTAQADLAKIRYQNRQTRFANAEQEKKDKAAKRQAAIDKMKAAAAAKKANKPD
ncbi:MAG: electron transport complex subunit RsxC [Methyloprofundus sp.]|nr:electron transport complex subunit RsxC [Methyloprofundus sp.]